MLKSAASLSRVSLLVVLATGAFVASACTSDQPKRTDDAGDVTAPEDAGNDGAADPRDAGAVDAGEVPVVEQQADAGHIGDARVDPLLNGEPALTPPKKAQVDPLQVTIFNRLLVKPKSKIGGNDVQALAEKVTGDKIDMVRKTAGTFWLLQFSPTKPARTAKEQKKLIDALEKSGNFEIVEGDQIMTIK